MDEAAVRELYRRRDSLDPSKRAVVDELYRRMSGGNAVNQPQGQVSGISQTASARTQQAGVGGTLADLASGAGAGFMSTVFHGGDLIRRGLGMERIIDRPEVQQAMTAPDTFAGQAGKFVEQGAEFAVPLSKLTKATAGMGLLRRMGVEALGGTGVSAVQSGGDPFSMTLGAALGGAVPAVGAAASGGARIVKQAAQGAQEGGFGGAVASVVRKVTDLDPVDAMMRAIKPRNTRIDFGNALRESLPELKASEAALGKPIETIEDLLSATKDAKKRLWAAREEILGPAREMGSQVDGNDIADAIERSIPKRTAQMDPGKAESIVRGAQTYRKKLSLDEAESLLREVNNELEAYYNKLPPGRAKSESDPAIAPILAEAKALRASIEKTLGAEGQGAGARELARRYGKLMEIEDAAYRRVNVANRQQPESLSEQMGNWSAAGDIARGAWALSRGDIRGMADVAAGTAKREAAKFAKEQQTTNALIRRSMAAVKSKPAPYPKYTPPKVAGLLEAGPTRMGPGADTSGITVKQAKSTVARDPKTGRMKRVYTSEGR